MNNLNEKTLVLNAFTRIDNKNEDFKNVYEWFIRAYYLNLGNPSIENNLNSKISTRVIEDSKYKEE